MELYDNLDDGWKAFGAELTGNATGPGALNECW